MTHFGIRVTRLALLAVVLAIGLTGAGCKKSQDTGGTPAPDPAPPGGPGSPPDLLAKLPGGDEFAAGKKVYTDNNCAQCHKLGETGGGPGGPPGPGGKMPGGGMGPNLTKVGAAAEHTNEWLAIHIRDPKKHKPGSRMPASGPEKISDADLEKLVEYLASRK